MYLYKSPYNMVSFITDDIVDDVRDYYVKAGKKSPPPPGQAVDFHVCFLNHETFKLNMFAVL